MFNIYNIQISMRKSNKKLKFLLQFYNAYIMIILIDCVCVCVCVGGGVID